MRDKVININVTEGAVDDFEPWESSEKKEKTVENRKFCDKNLKQAVAELGQTQVKLEVVNDVVVKVRS